MGSKLDVDEEVLKMLDDILKTQHSFARKATYHADHRFTDLYHLLTDDSWISTALELVLHNTGARTAGIDGVTKADFKQSGYREQFAATLKADLRTKHYCPQPVRRHYIPKSNGKTRPLGIPTIRDRVVQMLLKMMLEPIFESDFLDCSKGFRPGRRTMDAIAVCYRLITPRNSYFYVIEGDIKACFDNIQHTILLKLLARRIGDRHILNLIGRFLKAGMMEGTLFHRTEHGTPQGGILSPLLANVYLHELDTWWWKHYGSIDRHARERRRKQGLTNCIYVRYADDWIVLCNGTKAQAEAVRDEIQQFLHTTLHLDLSEEKTLVTHACDGFDFLGFHVQHYPAHDGQKATTLVRPAEKSVQRLKDTVRTITNRKGYVDNPLYKFHALNAVLRGWMNYYRHCSASQQASWLDHWVYKRVERWLVTRHKTCYREMYKRYLHLEGERRNFGVPRSDGSLVFLYQMKDVPIKRYRARTHANPYLQLDTMPLETEPGETPLQESPWIGRSAQSHWRNIRDDVMERDAYQCTECGSQEALEAHHIIPRHRGGQDILDNLQTLCDACHLKRGDDGQPRKEPK